MSFEDVLAGRQRWHVACADALVFLRGLPGNAVDVVFCSPPFTNARTYGIDADRETEDWVMWMRPIVREACRVSKSLAFFNVSDRVEDCIYGGGPELLFADLYRMHRLVGVRPYVWHKNNPHDDEAPNNGQPGSGGKHFHRNCWEPVYGFADPAKLPPPWSDPTAFGKPPKCPPGGDPTHRNRDGIRAGRVVHTKRYPDGEMREQAYAPPAIANPGNVIRALVGGGHLGHPLAHKGEAPMPLAVAERFVCWFCPPDGVVCDPFTGSGTTLDAAVTHGRRFVGCDLRQSQVDLAARRIRTVTPALC